MSIQNFYTQAAQRDFARPFQFRLAQFANINFSEAHYVYVETAALPGRQINNVQVPYMGLQFNVPGTASYPGSGGYNVTFRCDSDYNIREALEVATFNTFDEKSSSGQYSIPQEDFSMVLWLLGKNGPDDIVREYTLRGAYLVSLADAAYDIKDSGTVQTIQATVAYQYWTVARFSGAKGTPTQINPNDMGSTVTPSVWGAVRM